MLFMGKRHFPFGVIVVLMSSLVNPKERWPWYFNCEYKASADKAAFFVICISALLQKWRIWGRLAISAASSRNLE